MLLTIPELLSSDELATAQQLCAQGPWGDGRDTAGPQARRVKNNEQLAQDSEAAAHIHAMVLAALNRSTLFLSAALPARVFTPRVNRYGGDHNAYGEHVDNSIRLMPDEHGSAQLVRTDISCSIFLNAPQDYEGGELLIHDALSPQRVKLPAGHAVIYPGTTLHQVTPVTHGQRLACFFWVQSLVRSCEQRRLLFDMDMALLALRARHGESAETTALTGTYHNLLRQWAQT
jgi:PKHD-type hydroxylase